MQKKYKKFITTAATATLVASALVPVASAASFSDTAGNTHETAIEALVSKGIISGYPNGTFQPNKTLTRSDVVKLLGKYLVSQGYDVPSDYKTNMRFTDLRSTSQDELLQYAALVKDNGVFNGSNGNLLPNDPITRENMAVVLVRAYSNIQDFDFLDYVLHQEFDEDVTDYNAAKAEARSAIKVLDYYNVTGVSKFNPKSSTTRGQFSSFLYKMLQVEVPGADLKTVEVVDATTLKVTLADDSVHTVKLNETLQDGKETTVTFEIESKKYTTKVTYKANLTVKTAEVTGANKLKVTLSDNSVHEITLDKDLPENEETTVAFKIGGKDYSAKVTYVVTQVKVASVTAKNGGQFDIKFNQKVNLPEHLTAAQLAGYVTLSSIDSNTTPPLKHGYLSADGRTLTVVTDGTTALAGRYVVKVKDVKNAAGAVVTAYDEILNFGVDTTAPALVSTTNTDAKTVRVLFSEPLRAFANGAIGFKLANGTNVTGVTGSIDTGGWYVDLDLTNATVGGQPLAAGTAIYATFAGLRDIAGNFSNPNPITTSFAVGGLDGVKPALTSVTQTGPKKFKLTFSERIHKPEPTDLELKLGTTSKPIVSIDAVAGDNRSFIVTTLEDLLGVYNVGTAPTKFIRDISGETNTFAIMHAFTLDTAAPEVASTVVTRVGNDEYLDISLNKDVTLTSASRVTATGNYLKDGVTHSFAGAPTTVAYKNNDNQTVVRVKLNELLTSGDTANATYNVTLAFTDVKSVYGVNTANKAVSFVRAGDLNNNQNVLTTPVVMTSVTSGSGLTNNQVKLVFNHDVDAATATIASNYTIQNARVTNAAVLSDALNTVILTLAANETPNDGERALFINNVKAKNSVATQPNLSVAVNLKENVAPTATSAAFISANQVKVTFSEAVSGLDVTTFEATTPAGGATIASIAPSTTANEVVLTFGTTVPTATVVTLKKGATVGNATDAAGNKLVDTFTFTTIAP